MIYRWNECKGSQNNNKHLCPHCINWDTHLVDEPDCHCQPKIEFIDRTLVSLDPPKLETITASLGTAVLCSKCQTVTTRDYPAYHIAEDIISLDGGVPNPPKCAKCRS